MEIGQNLNALGRENSFLMEPLDHMDPTKSINDIMTRRLKNRERQRRYRARKRLEADMKKAGTINSSTPFLLEMPANGIPSNSDTRTHCRRDWKKDARAAHAAKEQEVTLAIEYQVGTLLPSGAEAKAPIESEFQSKNSHVQDNSERRLTPGRRHWKADARNRKN
ncbi:hypothetical protein U1Q18_021518 [Sarracenia purpurea var. burkii]